MTTVSQPLIIPGAPARFEEELNAFVVGRHATAETILRGDGWSSDMRLNLSRVEMFGGADQVPELLASMLLFADGADHRRLRRLVAPAFAPRRMEKFRVRVAEIVDAALAGLAAYDDFDVLSEYAYPVTVAVIAELLDVGADGAELLLAETPALAGILEASPTELQLQGAAEASMRCVMFLLPLLDERRRFPGDDFLSALQQEIDGDQLTIDETIATTLLLLTAGHETTANLVANGVLDLLQAPDQLALLRERPGLVPCAVEEILRHNPPVHVVGRTATRAQEIEGLPVALGQSVVVGLTAANRDPERFPDPDRFDISRADFGHLAFGAGPHFCLGFGLAKIEAEEALGRLIRSTPDLALVEPNPTRRTSTTFHAFNRLEVTR